jgi:hypothetical protein
MAHCGAWETALHWLSKKQKKAGQDREGKKKAGRKKTGRKKARQTKVTLKPNSAVRETVGPLQTG